MKHFYFLCVFTLLIYVQGFSQVTIEKLPGLDGGNFTSIIEFRDTLYTITISSEVFYSADYGSTWQQDERFNLSWTPAFEVKEGSFLIVDDSAEQFYAGGSTGLTIYSTGNPQQPTEIPAFFGSRGSLGDMIVSDTALYASYRYSPSSQGEIIKSTDGGLTWATHDATGRFMDKLAVTEDGKFLAASGDDLFLSEPGGTSFTELSIPTEQNNIVTDVLVSGTTFYITTHFNGVFSSTDEGATWTKILEASAFSITELSDGTLVVGGIDAHIYTSSDGGTNWSDSDLGLTSTPFNNQGVSDLVELSDGTLLASMVWGDVFNNVFSNPSPGVIASTDGGTSWSNSNSGLAAQTIVQVFYDEAEDNIYLYAKGSGVYKWIADTESWEAIGNPPDISGLQEFINAAPGWGAVGNVVQLGKNPVSGEFRLVSTYITLYLDAETNTWEYVEHDPHDFSAPVSLGYFEDGTAFVHETAVFTGIYTSTDGIAWTEIPENPNGANISKFKAADGYLVYFDNYSFDGEVGAHYSEDSGTTWTYIQAEREETFGIGDVFFDPHSSEILSVIQVYSPEFRTFIERYNLNDGSYSEQTITADIELSQPAFEEIIQLPNGAVVVHITDLIGNEFGPLGYFYANGETFTRLAADELPAARADEVVITSDSQILFRYGSDMYNTTIPTGTSVENPEAFTPSAFRLMPNYPNPFNPSTQLRFELAQAAPTTITVYSMLGQKVSELKLGSLTAGAHEVTFDASFLSSGIYLYTVQSGAAIRSGRMTLIK